MQRLLLAIGLFAALFVAPVSAQPAAPPSDPPITATPAMWVVHGPKATVYLLGSIHVLPRNVNWHTPEVSAAINHSDTFVFEVPMDEDSRAHAAAYFIRQGLLSLSTSLPSFFDAEMRSDYREVITLTHADPTYLVYMRPWLAALVLQGVASGNTGFVAAEGVDNKVYGEAKARGVGQFRALETYEQQIQLLMGDGNLADEVQLLRVTFKKIIKDREPSLPGLFAAWKKGDVKGLASYGPDSSAMTPEAKKALLEDRNRAWVPQIVGMLNEQHTFFITVGAGHLVGKTGVPNLLRAQGYKVDGP
jgi:uncharacterized protein YbaP (TraB family)